MRELFLCLEISADFLAGARQDTLEKHYQDVYKPLLTFLYQHPKCVCAMGFTGFQLALYAKKHPEALELLGELTKRNQVELLGGGYYAPVFPLLFPADRSAQLEKLTAALRSTIGKRPRGMQLFGSMWDSSLVTTMHSCGMEYVTVDASLLDAAKTHVLPLITSDQGRTLKVFPVLNRLLPLPSESGEAWIQRIKNSVSSELGPESSGAAEEQAVVCLSFDPEQLALFLESPCCTFFQEMNESDAFSCAADGVAFSTPQRVCRLLRRFVTAYVPAGMDGTISRWAQSPYKAQEDHGRFPLTIHDFLNVYPHNRRLYERMVYVSMLITNCHGDRIRKAAAREKLWEAQSGFAYVTPGSGLPAVASDRQQAYRALNEAERLVREAAEYKEAVTSYDYNADGLNEYVCSMEKYHAVLSVQAAAITELEIMHAGGNYAANLSRRAEFDAVSDRYTRGFFVEHLLEESESEPYMHGKPCGAGIFSQIRFAERKFDQKRREIHLEGRGEYGQLQQPVRLLKSYAITSDGMSVQYILKNESPFKLTGVLFVESNFSQTEFASATHEVQYEAELIIGGEKTTVDCGAPFRTGGGVSYVQITDSVDKNTFVFAPNEDAGFCALPVDFRRPICSDRAELTSQTVCISFFWKVDIDPGRDLEKTVGLNIIPAKKDRGKKKLRAVAAADGK